MNRLSQLPFYLVDMQQLQRMPSLKKMAHSGLLIITLVWFWQKAGSSSYEHTFPNGPNTKNAFMCRGWR